MENLWNDHAPPEYGGENAEYYRLVYDQYALCISSAEEITRVRQHANTFFLGLHTAIIATIAVMLSQSESLFLRGAAFIGLFSGCLLSIVWARLIRSYRAINTIKFEVLGQLEQSLPSSPYWRAEWSELSKRHSGYIALTKLEARVPVVAIWTYILLFLYATAYATWPNLSRYFAS